MSNTAFARVLPVRKQETPSRRPHLRPLDRPVKRRRPRVVYAVTAVVGALVIGAAQLGLSIATTQTTYDIRSLTEQQRSLTLQSQELYDEVAGLSSPQYLAANAAALGMIVGGTPTYLRLSDAALIGAGEATSMTSVDASKGQVVANALISDTPLVTVPKATIQGETAPAASENAQETPALPPAVTDGLPTPETH